MEKDYLVEFNKDIKPLIITFGGIGGGIYKIFIDMNKFIYYKFVYLIYIIFQFFA